MTQSRREFLGAAAAATGLSVAVGNAPAQARRALPVVIASNNGLRGVKVAYDRIAAGDDTLDAIVAGVNIQELDPTDQSVGLGGLPNEEGGASLSCS